MLVIKIGYKNNLVNSLERNGGRKLNVLLEAIVRQWRKHKRWQKADNQGWRMLGKLFIESKKNTDSFKCQWLTRNINRLYRLTRGYGNPWKSYKGF